MADLVVPKGAKDLTDLTEKEEKTLRNQFLMCDVAKRFLLLRAFEGRAHKAVRLGSFEEYCKEVLDLSHDHAHLSKLVAAARVERALIGEMCDVSHILEAKKPAITIRVAAEIAKLPEEKWAGVYGEYQLRDKHGNRTPSDLLTELKRIVKRESGQSEPEPTPIAPVVAARPKADLTPIIPAVYDGTPEQAAAEIEDADEHGRADDMDGNEDAEAVLTEQSAAQIMDELAAGDIAFDDSGGRLCAAVALLRQYVVVYKSADQMAAHELFRDVVALLKEFGK